MAKNIFVFSMLMLVIFTDTKLWPISSICKNSSTIEIDSCYLSIPFGSKVLVSHKFPSKFDSEPYDAKDSNTLPHLREIYKVIGCFETINNKYSYEYPYLESEFVSVSYFERKIQIRNQSHNFRSYCRKLSKLGPYETFYTLSFQKSLAEGFLLLHHKAESKTYVLKIFEHSFDDLSSYYLVCYIDDSQNIHISSFAMYENEIEFIKTAVINVSESGKFEII